MFLSAFLQIYAVICWNCNVHTLVSSFFWILSLGLAKIRWSVHFLTHISHYWPNFWSIYTFFFPFMAFTEVRNLLNSPQHMYLFHSLSAVLWFGRCLLFLFSHLSIYLSIWLCFMESVNPCRLFNGKWCLHIHTHKNSLGQPAGANRIHWLLRCRVFGPHPRRKSCIWQKTIWCLGSSNAGALEIVGYPSVAIAPRSTLSKDYTVLFHPEMREQTLALLARVELKVRKRSYLLPNAS